MVNAVVVRITQGMVRGAIKTTELGIPYYSFRAIPYAKPPVGKLRFKVRNSLKTAVAQWSKS